MLLHMLPLVLALAGQPTPRQAAMPQVSSADARPLFDAAVKQAKAENKEVFLWFSATW